MVRASPFPFLLIHAMINLNLEWLIKFIQQYKRLKSKGIKIMAGGHGGRRPGAGMRRGTKPPQDKASKSHGGRREGAGLKPGTVIADTASIHGGKQTPVAASMQRVMKRAAEQGLQDEIEQELAIDSTGMQPLDFMLAVMHMQKAPIGLRYSAAQASAPYVHPRLQAIMVKDASAKDKDKQLDDLLAAAEALKADREEAKRAKVLPSPTDTPLPPLQEIITPADQEAAQYVMAQAKGQQGGQAAPFMPAG